MGQLYQTGDDYPIADQIKTLGDSELLDFWEETQILDKYLEDEFSSNVRLATSSLEYERLILTELQIRSSVRRIAP